MAARLPFCGHGQRLVSSLLQAMGERVGDQGDLSPGSNSVMDWSVVEAVGRPRYCSRTERRLQRQARAQALLIGLPLKGGSAQNGGSVKRPRASPVANDVGRPISASQTLTGQVPRPFSARSRTGQVGGRRRSTRRRPGRSPSCLRHRFMDWSSVYVRWDLEALLEGQTVAVAAWLGAQALLMGLRLKVPPSAQNAEFRQAPTWLTGG